MVRKANVAADQFPLATQAGFMAITTKGYGNCLFHAFSDQMYGNQSMHVSIRKRVVEYMRTHSEEFKDFISDTSSHRRAPTRKNVRSAYSSSQNASCDSIGKEARNENYERYLALMSQNGTPGDDCEITAFSRAYNKDIVVFQKIGNTLVKHATPDGLEREKVYIALHAFEHYSSLRKIDGSLPNEMSTPTVEKKESKTKAAPSQTAPIEVKTTDEVFSSGVSKTKAAAPKAATIKATPSKTAPLKAKIMKNVLSSEESKIKAAPSKLAPIPASTIKRVLSSVEDSSEDEDPIRAPFKRKTAPAEIKATKRSFTPDDESEDSDPVRPSFKRRKRGKSAPAPTSTLKSAKTKLPRSASLPARIYATPSRRLFSKKVLALRSDAMEA